MLFNVIYLTFLTYKVECLIMILQAELGFADFILALSPILPCVLEPCSNLLPAIRAPVAFWLLSTSFPLPIFFLVSSPTSRLTYI